MKKNIYFIGLFLSLGYLIQCSHDSPKTSSVETIIYPLEQTTLITDLAPYVEEMEIIEIKENEETLMNETGKIIIDKKGNFFTPNNNKVLMFRSDGTFIRKITEKGKGPKEYIGASDMALSEDGEELMILDIKRVLCFGINDTTLFREIKIPSHMYSDDLAPAKDGGAYLFTAYQHDTAKHKVYQIDRNGTTLRHYLKATDCFFSFGNLTQVSGNNYLLRPQYGNHIVYKLTPDSLMPYYKIDFKDKNIPENYYDANADDGFGAYMNAPYYKFPMYFQETERHLYFSVTNPDVKVDNFIYSKENKNGIHWVDSDNDPSPTSRMIASDNDYFYINVSRDVIEQTNTKEYGALYHFLREAINKKGTIDPDNDNPLIVKIKFKI